MISLDIRTQEGSTSDGSRQARHPMRVEQKKTLRRLCAALALIALILVGRFAESMHSAEVGHRVCPEHGELLHVANVHDHADESDVPVGAQVIPAKSAPEHHHCQIANFLNSSGASWTPAHTDSHAFLVPGVADAARAESARVTRAPLSFAPKHSPPAHTV